jgi:outer membrane protein
LIVSSLIFSPSLYAAKNLNVGVVNVEKIYSSYEKAEAAREKIQDTKQDKQIELSKKQAEFQRLVAEYNNKKDTLKESEKENYAKKINDLRAEIQTFIRLSNQQLVAENRTKAQGLLNEISEVIQDYAKEKKYDLIVDKKSLPYFSGELDISDEIIKILNQSQ